MKRWQIALLVVMVLIVAAAVIFWPRTVRQRIRLKNSMDITVHVTVRRVRPRPTVAERDMAPGERAGVFYRYTEAELANASDHLISVAVDTPQGMLLATGEFRGADIYGKTLVLRHGMIEVVER